ncbi:hypothetical protein HYPSUDRAFT_1029078 [Hypholoma sublateritium FD-334 SS-4]|uniref:F-box domain-containing protein n=1 Tax=Hypholoma sublateritium (strain FD-334 SS-4) TaxID=945553 RepID=A0A0D2LGJ8_HYPSF|nr:hypothetical protein HYPSUDRAFT_1029078 [Hypholoma sublateritium FD-334 SS-4]
MAPTLPHELEELVLCHLQYDPAALKACSLVCYRFRIASQKLIFRNILVDFSSSSSKTARSTPKVSPFLLREFLTATPRIANSIRGIDFIADSYRLQDLDATFLPCLPFLENLRSISLDTNSVRPIYWQHLSLHAQRSLYSMSYSSRIVAMRFRRVFELPVSLLAECRALEALSLTSVTFQQENMLRNPGGTWTPSAQSQSPRLKSLHLSISHDAFRAFTELFTGSPALLDSTALVRLSVTIFSPRFDYARLHDFLRTVGSSLEVFCFSPMSPLTVSSSPRLTCMHCPA